MEGDIGVGEYRLAAALRLVRVACWFGAPMACYTVRVAWPSLRSAYEDLVRRAIPVWPVTLFRLGQLSRLMTVWYRGGDAYRVT